MRVQVGEAPHRRRIAVPALDVHTAQPVVAPEPDRRRVDVHRAGRARRGHGGTRCLGHGDVAGLAPAHRAPRKPPLARVGPPDGGISATVAAPITRHRHIASLAPTMGALATRRGIDDPPGSRAGPPNRDIGAPITVIVGRHRHIARLTPDRRVLLTRRRIDCPPLTRRRPPDPNIQHTIPIEIGAHRDVAGLAPAHRAPRKPPLARVGPPDGGISATVAAPITRHRHIASLAPTMGALATRRGIDDPPGSRAGPPNRDIGAPITVIVGRHRHIARLTPDRRVLLTRRRIDCPPLTRRRPPDPNIQQTIPIEIAVVAHRGWRRGPSIRTGGPSKVMYELSPSLAHCQGRRRTGLVTSAEMASIEQQLSFGWRWRVARRAVRRRPTPRGGGLHGRRPPGREARGATRSCCAFSVQVRGDEARRTGAERTQKTAG